MKEDKQDNMIDGNLIWIPRFRLENAIFEDSLDYSKGSISREKVVSDRIGDPTPILHAGYEG